MATLRDHLAAALGTSYSIERDVGGGGLSRVYVAQDRSLGRRLVVKVAQIGGHGHSRDGMCHEDMKSLPAR